MKTVLEAMNLYVIKTLFKFSVISEVWYSIMEWRINRSNNIFKFQKKIFQIVSDVSNRISYKQIFNYYSILRLFFMHTRYDMFY
jgi:hypothetical protein